MPADWGGSGCRGPVHIRQGVRCLLVSDEQGLMRVFPLVESATDYYKVMTRSDWMPALVEVTI